MSRTPPTTHLTMREEITMKCRSVVVMSLLLVGFAVFWHVHDASGQGSRGWITLLGLWYIFIAHQPFLL